MKRIAVIIVAGGNGIRMGGAKPKQFLFLDSLPVLGHTINVFAEAFPGAEIVVVLPGAYTDYWRNLCSRFEVKAHTVTEGGEQRFHSVCNGLSALKSDPELIAVQDGVRPLGRCEMIQRVAEAAAVHGAAIPVVEPVDSFRKVDEQGSHITDRRRLRIVQTPQVFRAEVLRKAYQAEYCAAFTDDASVVEATGNSIFLCQGEASNLKITTPDDLIIAQAILTARHETADSDQNDGKHL